LEDGARLSEDDAQSPGKGSTGEEENDDRTMPTKKWVKRRRFKVKRQQSHNRNANGRRKYSNPQEDVEVVRGSRETMIAVWENETPKYVRGLMNQLDTTTKNKAT
jgi:hypothetical protein